MSDTLSPTGHASFGWCLGRECRKRKKIVENNKQTITLRVGAAVTDFFRQ